jgi:hypothetical protein
MLALTGFETAIHSPHHLGDSHAADRCIVGSSGAHTHAIDVESPLVPGAITTVLGETAEPREFRGEDLSASKFL